MKIRVFDNWKEYTGASEGSGRSRKIWLNGPDGEIGLFKFNKSNETKENISEKIATQIARILDIESAYVEIGTYQGQNGCMSYNILNIIFRENNEVILILVK